ncbi:MAG: FG-GAP repeat protein, partial [Roseofilum sp. SID1]
GLDDLIVGASGADPNGGNSGRSYVVFGKSDGTTVNLSDITAGTGGFALDGEAGSDRSGRSVSAAGDVNGDGLDDLIVGAEDADPNGNNSGRSYVVFGKSDGTTVNLSDITAGTGGFALDGEAAFDNSGYSVSSAGDVNGDGLDDLIVGAYGADANGGNSGRSYVVFGKSDGTTVNLSDITAGTGGFAIDGEAGNDFSGTSVSSAGDVNGDGLDDLIVGAEDADPNGTANAGRSYVVFGKSDGTTVNLSNITAGTGGFALDGEAALDGSGYSVSSAGDVNGDGLDDLIVGADDADPNGSNSGRSYVVFGKSDGTTVNLSDITAGTGGFALDGEAALDESGISVSSAGDVNGDGFDDLIVGAFGADPNGNRSGRSYVVFGGNFTAAVTQMGTTGADNLTVTANSEALVGGEGNDVLSDGGFSDILLYGGAGNDQLQIANTSFSHLDGGLGDDTLTFGGAGMALNLTGSSDNTKIKGLETIDLTGSGNNSLTLDYASLLHLVSESTSGSGFRTLRVTGNVGDAVTANLSALGFTSSSSGGFTTYELNQLRLVVSDNVDQTGIMI